MGFIAFILVLATLSAFFETVDNMSDLAPFIAVFLAIMGGYRFTKRLIEQRKALREANDREELKEELREEIRNEMKQEENKGTTEEPYYPDVKYFHR